MAIIQLHNQLTGEHPDAAELDSACCAHAIEAITVVRCDEKPLKPDNSCQRSWEVCGGFTRHWNTSPRWDRRVSRLAEPTPIVAVFSLGRHSASHGEPHANLCHLKVKGRSEEDGN